MRSLFDQYTQHENRLTHALACCLNEDRGLFRRFVRWVLGGQAVAPGRLEIAEQQLPGHPEVSEDEADRRGLPDIWIHDGESWALLIESKIASPVTEDQMRRHLRTAEHRGFRDVRALAIGVRAQPKAALPDRVRYEKWTEVYKWFRVQARTSGWAARFAEYMEALEGRLIADEYLREGTLTVFSGIPFGEKDLYNYLEAKRVLTLAMDQLQSRGDLERQLGMDPRGERRPAITGKDASYVWDFLPLKVARGDKPFTSFPHPTLSIQSERVFVITTIPNGIGRDLRRNFTRLTEERFCGLIRHVGENLSCALGEERGAAPWLEVIQRHYPTQRSRPVVDARLEYDLGTIADTGKGRGVRSQPEWLEATYKAFTSKRSNMQLGIGAIFPYRACSVVRTPRALDLFAKTWLACRPLLDVVLGKTPVE